MSTNKAILGSLKVNGDLAVNTINGQSYTTPGDYHTVLELDIDQYASKDILFTTNYILKKGESVTCTVTSIDDDPDKNERSSGFHILRNNAGNLEETILNKIVPNTSIGDCIEVIDYSFSLLPITSQVSMTENKSGFILLNHSATSDRTITYTMNFSDKLHYRPLSYFIESHAETTDQVERDQYSSIMNEVDQTANLVGWNENSQNIAIHPISGSNSSNISNIIIDGPYYYEDSNKLIYNPDHMYTKLMLGNLGSSLFADVNNILTWGGVNVVTDTMLTNRLDSLPSSDTLTIHLGAMDDDGPYTISGTELQFQTDYHWSTMRFKYPDTSIREFVPLELIVRNNDNNVPHANLYWNNSPVVTLLNADDSYTPTIMNIPGYNSALTIGERTESSGMIRYNGTNPYPTMDFGIAQGDDGVDTGTKYFDLGNQRVRFWSAVDFYDGIHEPSDESLKDDIKIVDHDECQLVFDAIDVKTYKRNDMNSDKKRIGFVAQDFDAIIPEEFQNIVGKTTNDKLSLDYARITCILWSVVKNQQGTITDMVNRIQQLETPNI